MGCTCFIGSSWLMQMSLLSINIQIGTTKKDFQLKFKIIYLIFNYYFSICTILLFSAYSNSLYHFQFSFFVSLPIPSTFWSSVGTHCWRADFSLWRKLLDNYFGILLKFIANTINLISCDKNTQLQTH